jgi:hypothetical protein
VTSALESNIAGRDVKQTVINFGDVLSGNFSNNNFFVQMFNNVRFAFEAHWPEMLFVAGVAYFCGFSSVFVVAAMR